MKTVTIELPNTMLDAFLPYCNTLGLQKVEVVDKVEREDNAWVN